jgi:hypothetical protein
MQCIARDTSRNFLPFVSHGFAVRVVVNQSDVLERLRGALPFGVRITEIDEPHTTYAIDSCPDNRHVLSVDGEQIAGPARLQSILDAFESHAVVRISERAPEHVFVHSGVVAWQGNAILFPGYSFYGKTARPTFPTNMPCSTVKGSSIHTHGRCKFANMVNRGKWRLA